MKKNVILLFLRKIDARAVEQALIDFHGLSKYGGGLLNKIISIARNNVIYSWASSRCRELLRLAGYPGF